MRSHWESQIHEIVELKEGLPIFVAKPEGNAKGRSRVLHRSLLLPCKFLPPDGPADKDRSAPEKKEIAKIKSDNRNRMTASSENESDDKIGYQGLTPAEIF